MATVSGIMRQDARQAEVRKRLARLEPESIQFLDDPRRGEGVAVELKDGRRAAVTYGGSATADEIVAAINAGLAG